ncbi:TAF-domain-containing protein [Rhodotorula sp. JG-1b]|nr:TAF-domain-containing protein [Rhodotorula sp. JG-1b]
MARQPATVSGVWRPDSVKDVAESLGIANLPDDVARALAGDESLKFMRHARRTKLKVDDLDHALKVRNLEPLWGFSSTASAVASQPFKKTVTPTGTVYHLDEQEIDLSKVIKTEVPTVPRDISFTAHWLAIEGVQPLIKENPTPQELARYAPKPAHTALIPAGTSVAATASAPGQPPAAVTPLVKHVLSRELQLYFTRLVDALGSAGGSGGSGGAGAAGGPHESSAEIATNLHDLSALQRALDLFHAMLENPTLFVEPYLHQLTPPILTCLLTAALPPVASRDAYPSPPTIRTLAASLLHLILERYAYAYPSLLPRITKTLLRGLAGEGRGLGARWGAARGLGGIVVGDGAAGGGGGGGNRAVREWIGGGLKPLGEMIEREEETYEGERAEVVREVFNVLRSSVLPSTTTTTTAAPPPPPSHAELVERYGPLFAEAISKEWQNGGRDVHEAISGRGGGGGGGRNVGGGGGGAAAAATAAGDADEEEQEQEQDDADEDDEDEMDDAM